MRTKKGFFKFSLGWSTYYFLEQNRGSFGLAFLQEDISKIAELSCLELDNDGLTVASNWSNVRSELDLENQVKRIRLNRERP